MSASPELGGKCRALRGDRGKPAYTGQNRITNSNTNKTQKNNRTESIGAVVVSA